MTASAHHHPSPTNRPYGKRGAAERWLGVFAACNGFVAVAMGAFAAHAARRWLEPPALELLRTGALYEMFHALAILATASVASKASAQRLFLASQLAFAVGILLFSGSLYVLAFTGHSLWGAMTPFGGVAFLVGWLLLAVGLWYFHNK